MSNSAPQPRLPLWVFVLCDALLVATAAVIAARSREPWSPGVTLAIVACVALGTLALLVPLVLRHERLKNEQLDDRQRALEALARTLTAAAEQIGIATAGLNEVGDLVQKNLRQADHLPQRLQEKIAEFQSQLANANEAEREELERELATLRASESERLEGIATQIAKATAEWSRLESATRQQLAATQDTLARIGPSAEQARAAALADLEASLARTGDALIQRVTRELDDRLAALRSGRAAPAQPAAEPLPPTPASAPAAEPPPSPEPTTPAAGDADPAAAPAASAPPKRARRPKREEPAPAATEATPAETAAPDEPAPTPTPAPAEPAMTPAAAAEPAAPVEAPPETMPATPAEAAPESTPPPPDQPAPPRRRTTRPAPTESEPALELGIDDSAPAAAVSERVLSSDGATRLIATAYIGIGNRLFLRGEGPGLTWDKGVPLQFVSIGKWRWETNEATAPVKFRLYKNDEVECSALGTVSIDPGHQQEVMANF